MQNEETDKNNEMGDLKFTEILEESWKISKV